MFYGNLIQKITFFKFCSKVNLVRDFCVKIVFVVLSVFAGKGIVFGQLSPNYIIYVHYTLNKFHFLASIVILLLLFKIIELNELLLKRKYFYIEVLKKQQVIIN